jgi:hypothetical protein
MKLQTRGGIMSDHAAKGYQDNERLVWKEVAMISIKQGI